MADLECDPTCTSPTRTERSGRNCRSEAAGSTRTSPDRRTATERTPALLGDPRNDENVIVAGLHCAHILFYNRVLDELANRI